MREVLMTGLGRRTFVTDWARAVARFADVRGVSASSQAPAGSTVERRGLAAGEIGGIPTVFVASPKIRPARLFWRTNGELRARAFQRAIAAQSWQPDLVHSHFFSESLPALHLGRRLGVPVVVTEHTSGLATDDPPRHLSRQGIEMMRTVYAAADAVLLVGAEQLSGVEALGLEGNFSVLPNPVDTDAFTLKPPGRRPPWIVSVGFLLPRKRHDLLIEAFRHVLDEIPDARLHIVGDGERRDRLAHMIRDHGLEDAVTLHGRVSRPDVERLLHQAALYVHTSERESFGMALIEALLTGTPVVSVRCGGVSEELAPAVGTAVDVAEPRPLAAAIVAALSQGDYAEPQEIRRWAETRYGAPAVAAGVQKVYEQLWATR